MTDRAARHRVAKGAADFNALLSASHAHSALIALGWKDCDFGNYPRDGTLFEVCTPGPSTGIFTASCPNDDIPSTIYVKDGGEVYLYGPGGLMWRPIKPKEPAR